MKNYDDINSGKIDTKLCPECQPPEISRCKCSISERKCINGHIWSRKYYEGDKRYLCINPLMMINIYLISNS